MMIPVGRDVHRRPVALQETKSRPASFLTSPWPRLQRLAVLPRSQAQANGFTLVELLITIAIISLLSALAFPQFLNARERADAKAKVGELVGIAKECAVFNAEADESPTTVHPPTGGEIPCGGSTPSKQNMLSRPWNASLTIECLGTMIEDATKVKIEVTEGGKMSCDKAA